MNTHIHAGLDQLTQAYIDGSITTDSLAQLNALLGESADARREFADLLNVDTALAAAAAGWMEVETGPSTFAGRSPRGRRLAIAATLALLAGGALWWQDSRRPFASVEKSLGSDSLPVGMALRGVTQMIAEGTVELLTARGALLVIEAPAEFRFASAQVLRMSRGRLAADVPPSAKGFTVITPSGDAVDLGTRFGVDVPAAGAAEIHVFEGEVVAKAHGAEARQSLLAGEAVSMAEGASSARNLRSAAFIQSDELLELKANGQRARAEAALDALARDPALIVALDFESEADHPGVSRTVQGRWPGSKAPEFINAGDHLKLDVGGERAWPLLTLAAWVRLDQLGAPYQSLLHTDGWDGGNFGQVHWMVTQSATMRFALWGNTLAPGATETQPYPDSLTPVLSDQGRWVHLVTVYDSAARTVRFYLNGRFDKETRQDVAYPAKLGSVRIGNWDREERKLSGRLDELVILGRAMSDDEVRALFEAGNPYL